VDSMEKTTKAIKQDLLKMTWYMRGGITYEEAANLGVQERELINEIIKENLETTKKSKMPFF